MLGIGQNLQRKTCEAKIRDRTAETIVLIVFSRVRTVLSGRKQHVQHAPSVKEQYGILWEVTTNTVN